ADLNRLKAESARADGDLVELRALEREATAQRQLLESYLSRFREATSRGDGNYVPADARIFSRATAPSEPYFPKVVPITISAFVAVLLLLTVFTLQRELFSGRAMVPAGRSAPEPAAELSMPVFEASIPANDRPSTASEPEEAHQEERRVVGMPQPPAM